MFDYAIVGGGIIGLASAHALSVAYPGASIVVFEKESRWAVHQTGHNSGVIHSGLYYVPGSLKADLCRRGNRSMLAFCAEHGVAHALTGKLVVATSEAQLEGLDRLYRRGIEHGLPVRYLTPAETSEREPHVSCVRALLVESTATCDFAAVAEALAALLRASGAELALSTAIGAIRFEGNGYALESEHAVVRTRVLVNFAGLHSDRVALLAGADPGSRIVPFRGEYYELSDAARPLVNGLIYPVPDPQFPFLGVHLTRGVDGAVHAGPNAVLATKREGYRWRDLDRHDIFDIASYPGFWRLARRNLRTGAAEVMRSLSRRQFARAVATLVPEIEPRHLVRAPAGVRAQALDRSGSLVDDFLLVSGPRALHVVNAPSPAATSSLEIARLVAQQVPAPSG